MTEPTRNPGCPRSLAIPLDTSEPAFAVWIEALRELGPEARLARAFELRRAMLQRIEQGIRQLHPEYTATQVFHARARIVLGEALHDEVYGGEGAAPAS